MLLTNTHPTSAMLPVKSPLLKSNDFRPSTTSAVLCTRALISELALLLQVDKLLGPGNQYVTAAKMLLQNSEAMVSIDMPAGPSEVLVIADAHASPAFVAADLLSQAEHGPDSQVAFLYIDPMLAGQQKHQAVSVEWLGG